MAKARLAKPKTVYSCQACGHVETKWLGRCPACQEWSTLVEELEAIVPARASATGVADGASPVAISEVGEHVGGPRRESGIGELDRVLGGGLVAGSIVLLGGDPGVGKSTLLLQALASFAARGGSAV
jgi:DNA repair protein RadA/Sms